MLEGSSEEYEIILTVEVSIVEKELASHTTGITRHRTLTLERDPGPPASA